MIEKVNLAQKFALINEHWSPRIAGRVNDFDVKLAKLQGEFVWHHHDNEDELFLVVAGNLTIELRDQPAIRLEAGEFVIIPRGVAHRPVAETECHVLLFEPAGTLNTGSAVASEYTVVHPDTI
ncbi:MAG: cupin domain-containing protein [Anaerolineaceae bacterium]|nr:cupin domain-containing protein [Anaerolineae bacterium]MCB9456202.1 cupin domain-containing protein [Anaerolineaceae bacterium]